MRLARTLLSALALLRPLRTAEAADVDFAALSRRSDYLTGHPPARFYARSADPECHYDDYQHCAQRISSTLVKIHARSLEGAHIDGNHVHYEKPGNVNHGMRVLNRPHFDAGHHDLGRSKNGHYKNGPIGAPADPETDESSYFTRQVRAVPEDTAAVDMSHNIHHYGSKSSRDYHMEWVPRFESPGE